MKSPRNLGRGGEGEDLERGNYSRLPFAGTENPRHQRALTALRQRPMTREHLDRAAGCSNGPELVAELRRRGLDLPCQRVPDFDRDGRPIRRGVYYLTESDQRRIVRWLAKRGRP